jgi:hypothetical protein
LTQPVIPGDVHRKHISKIKTETLSLKYSDPYTPNRRPNYNTQISKPGFEQRNTYWKASTNSFPEDILKKLNITSKENSNYKYVLELQKEYALLSASFDPLDKIRTNSAYYS